MKSQKPERIRFPDRLRAAIFSYNTLFCTTDTRSFRRKQKNTIRNTACMRAENDFTICTSRRRTAPSIRATRANIRAKQRQKKVGN